MKHAIVFLSCLLSSAFLAHADPGKEVTGKIYGTLIYASDLAEDGKKALTGPLREVIKQDKALSHLHYYELGKDHSPVYKAYESWLRPLNSSQKFMLTCEPKAQTTDGQKLEVSFWIDKEKVFSTSVIDVTYDVPLFISGPRWRDGKVVIAVELER